MRSHRDMRAKGLRQLMAVVLSLAMVLQGVPVAPTYASELDDTVDIAQSTVEETGTEETVAGAEQMEDEEGQDDDVSAESPLPQDSDGQEVVEQPGAITLGASNEQAEADGAGAADASGAVDAQPRTLEAQIAASDGASYRVTVVCDENAQVPEQAQLSVTELCTQAEEDPSQSVRIVGEEGLALRNLLLSAALDLGEHDRLFSSRYLDVQIVADGQPVEPLSAVQVTIETTAVPASCSAAIEAAMLTDEGLDVSAQAVSEGDTAQQLASRIETPRDCEPLVLENLTSGDKDTPSIVSFTSTRLGELGLAVVAGSLYSWDQRGLEFSILGPRHNVELALKDVAAPMLEEGIEPLQVLAAHVSPQASYDTTLWLDATVSQDAALAQDVVGQEGTLLACLVKDDSVAGEPTACDAMTEPLDFLAGEEQVLLAWKPQQAMLMAAADDEALIRTSKFKLDGYLYSGGTRRSRATTVHFVDQYGTHIDGLVPSVREYTIGQELDMYEYAESLDPSIAQEYEFKRVYLQLKYGEQKEFRYIQLQSADKSGDSASIYRIYFYRNAIQTDSIVGGTYRGMWYQTPITNDTPTNDVYLVFNHLANVTFQSVDKHGDPVANATFTLYSDENCFTEYEYKGGSVVATSDELGTVELGRLPRGTYYMKETHVPKGYKDYGTIHKIVIDGVNALPNVVHDEDDGSVLVSGIHDITFAKRWTDGYGEHENDSVTLTVFSDTTPMGSVTLNPQNNWGANDDQVVDGLDPRLSYVITETNISSGASNITKEWVPGMTERNISASVGYYLAKGFQANREYVLVAGNKALAGAGEGLVTKPIEADGDSLVGPVSDDELWKVSAVSADGVITLQNVDSGHYLDYSPNSTSWGLFDEAPKLVKHSNASGNINLYHRENKNESQPIYLSFDGDAVVTSPQVPNPPLFYIYQKIEARSVGITVTNKPTQYPLKMQNRSYPDDELLPSGTFVLYNEEEYNKYKSGAAATPTIQNLVVGADGYLTNEGSSVINLMADTYYLVQKDMASGYAPSTKPVEFIVAPMGNLRVPSADQQFPSYNYVSQVTEESVEYQLLKVPNQKAATLTLKKNLQDNLASGSESFSFTVLVQNGNGVALAGWQLKNNVKTDTNGKATITLAAGATDELFVPMGGTVTATETTGGYVTKVARGTAAASRGNSCVCKSISANETITFTNIRAICKIDHNGEQPFETLNDALSYARTNLKGKAATIKMLVDYQMPQGDALVLTASDDITLTTAPRAGTVSGQVFGYVGQGDTATITRGYSGGSMLVSSGSLTLSNITLDGNRSTYANLPTDGGIVNAKAGSLVLGLKATLQNAQVTGNGGAVAIAGGASLSMTGGKILECTAARGGGVYVAAGGSGSAVALTSGASIRTCEATTDDGGAIWCAQGSVALETNAEIVECSAAGSGGAIYATQGASVTLDGPYDNIGTQMLRIYNCTAVQAGGGVALADDSGASLVVRGGSCVLKSRTTAAGSLGGGVYAGTGTTVELDGTGAMPRSNGKVEPAYIAWCSTYYGRGGGLYAAEGASVVLALGGQIVNNGQDSGLSTLQGGGVYLDGATLSDDAGGVAKVAGNKATGEGGGVYAGNGSMLALGKRSELARNSAASGAGAYVQAGATMRMESDDSELAATVTNNTATGEGGGVYLEPNSKLELEGLVSITGKAAGTGDLYLAENATGNEIEATGNLTSGSRVDVWARDAVRDGLDIENDEPFGITTNTPSKEIEGLNAFVSQRAQLEEERSVKGEAGQGNTVVWRSHAVAVTLQVEGSHADLTHVFDFTITLPEGVESIAAKVNGEPRTFTATNNAFSLSRGQTLVLEDLSESAEYVITQTSAKVAPTPVENDGKFDPRVVAEKPAQGSDSTVEAVAQADDARVVTISQVAGSRGDPSRVTIINELPDEQVLPTGINDNAPIWAVIAATSLCALALLWLRRRRFARV